MLLCRVVGRVSSDRRASELDGRRLDLLETVDRRLRRHRPPLRRGRRARRGRGPARADRRRCLGAPGRGPGRACRSTSRWSPSSTARRPAWRCRMILCRVLGSTVATRKDAKLEGTKLLVVAEAEPDGAEREELHVAADAHRRRRGRPRAGRPSARRRG